MWVPNAKQIKYKRNFVELHILTNNRVRVMLLVRTGPWEFSAYIDLLFIYLFFPFIGWIALSAQS